MTIASRTFKLRRSERAAEQVDAAIGSALKPGTQPAFGSKREQRQIFRPRQAGKADETEAGGMAERFKAPVLKTGEAAMSPWVRIPLPPPDFLSKVMKSFEKAIFIVRLPHYFPHYSQSMCAIVRR